MNVTIYQANPATAQASLLVICLTPANKDFPFVYETRPTLKEAEEFAYASLSRGYRRADVFEQVPIVSYRIDE
ncbi:hypothetical protein HOU02_gp228 [Caulobacter phage CcrBL9]|uniref:Uncharacterized protein n=1 Tax=Caulobacter phage CcrBL9 TaxID=2283270 RepID=A0A385EFD9_9CAUD|nr:hypothetical protein HOU02_gp228 [Caulobacter phage CcrBL9]AXQ69497.1 hypothetical protein CcrBL9_gp473 [Caulobacter phage CcrBL9]